MEIRYPNYGSKMAESACKHLRRVGDNYGESCSDCGAQLAGFGNWATFPDCLHQWFDDPALDYVICYYCETQRKRDPNVKEIHTIQ